MRGELQPVDGLDHRRRAGPDRRARRCGSTRRVSASAPSLDAARAAAATREGERLVARRDQESAEKLEQAAAWAAEEQSERRLRGIGRRRARFAQGESE